MDQELKHIQQANDITRSRRASGQPAHGYGVQPVAGFKVKQEANSQFSAAFQKRYRLLTTQRLCVLA